MLVTLQPKDKNDIKRVFSLSPKQLLALDYGDFVNVDEAKALLGVQYSQVINSMLDNDTFSTSRKGYKRTAVGRRLAQLVESRR